MQDSQIPCKALLLMHGMATKVLAHSDVPVPAGNYILHTTVTILTWIDLTRPNWLSTGAARLVVFIKMLLDLLGNVGASHVHTFHIVLKFIGSCEKHGKTFCVMQSCHFWRTTRLDRHYNLGSKSLVRPSVQKAKVFFSLPFYLETKKIDEANRLWNML